MISGTNFEHRVAIRHKLGSLDLDVEFKITAPWTALFAPSGAGKTTILRMIAGLDRPQSGRIACSLDWPPIPRREFVFLDTATGVSLPPHRRVVGLVAQRPALFPHLSVLRNVLYRRPSMVRDDEERAAREQRIANILKLCRIDHISAKMPSHLSGGERQRVALARTLAAGPGRLLMLDEPFTGLEADLRDDLIRDLRAWLSQTNTPVLLVTHDIGEVFAAEAHVLKMANGRIVASGPAHQVLAEERTRLLQRLNPILSV